MVVTQKKLIVITSEIILVIINVDCLGYLHRVCDSSITEWYRLAFLCLVCVIAAVEQTYKRYDRACTVR